MSGRLLLVSDNDTDFRFWHEVARLAKAPIEKQTDSQGIAYFLESHPDSLVVWDAGNPETRGVESLLQSMAAPSRVFAITDAPINDDPDLFRPPAFAHHLYRRYEDPASFLFSKLIERSQSKEAFGLKAFFPDSIAHYERLITNAGQKLEIVDEVNQFLVSHNILGKLASLGADATDELIMNAVFDAPFEEGRGYYRRPLDRTVAFDLAGRERVEVEAAISKDLVGIRVADYFGSVDRNKVLMKLACNFRNSSYHAPVDDPGAGLGIHKIVRSALTLIVVVKPGKQTEVIVLFANKRTYKDVKLGFCFFSVFSRS